jgi:predicted enzyme related to lactoylglutathione lyase
VILDFLVEDIAAEQARLDDAGANFLARLNETEGFGVISTFVDPDGNYGQLMELRS